MRTKCKTQGGTSDYIGVSLAAENRRSSRKFDSLNPWVACIGYKVDGRSVSKKKSFPCERSAAIQYDKWVLELGLSRPLNILKPKVK